ncbi:hypothetical protein JCM19046_4317 [Bacillus sp. JCM 19046]|nr:hypothetical protein JCM19046_4317 [Bacillus sp. JCM 19046]
MRAYPIHPDFKSLEKTKLPFYPFLLPLLNKLVARKNSRITLPANLKMTKKTISGYNGDEITIHIYEPTDVETKNCLVYFHGGAFAIKEALITLISVSITHCKHLANLYLLIIDCCRSTHFLSV